MDLLRDPDVWPNSETHEIKTPCGKVFVHLGRLETGELTRFSLSFGKPGGCVAAWAQTTSKLMSVMLRAGFSVREIAEQLRGQTCYRGDNERGGEQAACLHQIAEVLDHAG